MEMNYSKQLVKRILVQYAIFGKLSSRSMFGGFGISHNGVMFGWVYNNQFYLRASATSVKLFIKLNMPPLNISTGVISKLLQYYCVTDEIWRNKPLLENLFRSAIDNALQDKENKKRTKESRLKDLPNITLSIERLLISVGIMNISTLHQLGAVEIYARLKRKYSHISINVLYSLSAAIEGCHVAILSTENKQTLALAYKRHIVGKINYVPKVI